MNHVDEVVRVHDVLKQFSSRGALVVEVGPLAADREGLILPGDEGDGLNDRRLDDLFAREDSPGDGVRALAVVVGAKIALVVDLKSEKLSVSSGVWLFSNPERVRTHSVVGDMRVALNTADELVEERGRDEEFKVGLLVNVAVLGSPTVGLVIRPSAVDAVTGRGSTSSVSGPEGKVHRRKPLTQAES